MGVGDLHPPSRHPGKWIGLGCPDVHVVHRRQRKGAVPFRRGAAVKDDAIGRCNDANGRPRGALVVRADDHVAVEDVVPGIQPELGSREQHVPLKETCQRRHGRRRQSAVIGIVT